VADIIQLPDNLISRMDRERLESFGGHSIARGRATRWHWYRKADGDEVFEIYRGSKGVDLLARIQRDRAHDIYRVHDLRGDLISTGMLELVLVKLDSYLARLHHKDPGPAA